MNGTRKPFGYKIRRFIKSQKMNSNEVIMVGDQLLTDVLAAKNAKVKVCLTDQLGKRDQIWTFFNRKIDNHLRGKMIKKGKITRIGG